jgi:hypothetical protein
MRRAVWAGVVATMAIAAAGCSGDPAPAPSEPPATSVAASPAASPSALIIPASSCLTGTYRLARFVGAGSNTYGTGQGGDITVAFTDGEYVMTGAGREPYTVTLAGQSALLTVDGTIEGVYSGTGDQVSFTRGRTTGSGTATAGGEKQTLTMAQVANVLALSGEGKLVCTENLLTITLKSVRLELEK